MAAAFLIVLAVPWLRGFFALHPNNVYDDGVSLGIAAVTAVLLTVLLSYDRWLPAVRDIFKRPS
jgi:cation-transporting ATPase E